MTDDIAYLNDRIECLENVVGELMEAIDSEASPNMENQLASLSVRWNATDDAIKTKHGKPIEVVI